MALDAQFMLEAAGLVLLFIIFNLPSLKRAEMNHAPQAWPRLKEFFLRVWGWFTWAIKHLWEGLLSYLGSAWKFTKWIFKSPFLLLAGIWKGYKWLRSNSKQIKQALLGIALMAPLYLEVVRTALLATIMILIYMAIAAWFLTHVGVAPAEEDEA